VSLIFLTPFAGYSIAAITNSRIHMRFGQRGIAIIAPICHIVTYIILALHPPYPVLVVCNLVSGFGNGLVDACFCAWVGVMDKTNTIQGFMHGCYSIGALFAPLIATAMVTNGLPWYYYYYVMVSSPRSKQQFFKCISLIFHAFAFGRLVFLPLKWWAWLLRFGPRLEKSLERNTSTMTTKEWVFESPSGPRLLGLPPSSSSLMWVPKVRAAPISCQVRYCVIAKDPFADKS
jgi:fucose permease